MRALVPVVAAVALVAAMSAAGIALSDRPGHETWMVAGVFGVAAVAMAMWPFGWRGATVAALLCVGGATLTLRLFWDYRDDPWFRSTPADCDGPCTGWYSFENPFLWCTWAIVGIVGVLVGSLLRAGRTLVAQGWASAGRCGCPIDGA